MNCILQIGSLLMAGYNEQIIIHYSLAQKQNWNGKQEIQMLQIYGIRFSNYVLLVLE